MTINREYRPDDNALLLSVESGSANQFIMDLKKGVKRGIDSKLMKGQAPLLASLGYLNTRTEIRGENYIMKDPERFALIRKMWDMMLSGAYTPYQILDIANNEWGLRTRKMRKRGAKMVSRSSIYRIFGDIFYTGMFMYAGKLYQGKHEAMITTEEYDKVQIMLGRKGRPRPKTHEFPYTGIIRCGMCDSMITAIEKTKIIKKTGQLKTFTYYYCSRKKNGIPCNQKTYVPGEELEKQIASEIDKISIHPDFKNWALEVLNESNDKEIQERTAVYESQQKAMNSAQSQIDNLTRMRYRDLINDDEFSREKKELQSQIATLAEKLRTTESRAATWIELTEKTFDFACYAREAFAKGDLTTKKEILIALGENFTLEDQKLVITSNEWLKPIVQHYPSIKNGMELARTGKNVDPERQKEAFASLRPKLRGRWDLNPRPLP